MFEIETTPKSVEFWSETRLPLSPVGQLAQGRLLLRQALASLEPGRDARLLAEFTTETTDFFDVENVLLYNVGTGAFKACSVNGVHVLRSKVASPAAPSGKHYANFHRYSLEDVEPLPTAEPALSFELPKLVSDSKPHQVWWQVKSAKVGPTADRLDGEFFMTVQLPCLPNQNISALIKPVLDGIICALHSAAGIEPEAISRLSAKIGAAPALVAQHLNSPVLPILQPRKVVTTYRNFVKWDPADELCTEFVVERCSNELPCRVWLSERVFH